MRIAVGVLATAALLVIPAATAGENLLVDPTFGTNGLVITSASSGNDFAAGLGVQPDGKVVVAGGANGDALALRYNPNGSLDTTFAGDGSTTVDFGGTSDGFFGVEVGPDGKLWFFGAGNNRFAAARFNANGTLDTTFGSGGKVTTEFPGSSQSIAFGGVLQPDGTLLLVGTAATGDYDLALASVKLNGDLNGAFSGDGRLLADPGNGRNDVGQDVVLRPDGSSVIGGTTETANGNSDFLLLKYDATGNLVGAFGQSGKLVIDFNGGNDNLFSLAPFPNGDVLAAGLAANGPSNATTDSALTVFNPVTGALVPSFSGDGKETFDAGSGRVDFLLDATVVPGLFPQDPNQTIYGAGAAVRSSGRLGCFAFDSGFQGGVRVATGDLFGTDDNNLCEDIVVGNPATGPRRLFVFGEADVNGGPSDILGRAFFIDPTNPNCPPPNCRFIQGTPGNDTIMGTPGKDLIIGGDGNDTVTGLGGDDILIGGPGTDTIDGGDGNDLLGGGLGGDQLIGGIGNDLVIAGEGNDTVTVGPGNDKVADGAGDDQVDGGDGDDVIGVVIVIDDQGVAQIVGVITAGEGDDSMDGGDGEDEVNGGAGNDAIQLGAGNDGNTGRGGPGRDRVSGGTGRDTVDGGPGPDSLFGEAGNDLLGDLQGTNRYDGGLGRDTCRGKGKKKSCEQR